MFFNAFLHDRKNLSPRREFCDTNTSADVICMPMREIVCKKLATRDMGANYVQLHGVAVKFLA